MDESLTPEQGAEVTFWPEIYVSTINGIEVEEAWYGKWNGHSSPITATIPAGETIVGFDIYGSDNNFIYSTIYTIDDLQMKFNFEAGKKYAVRFFVAGAYNAKTKTLGIYESPWEQGKIPLKSWEF
ncbi:MAG: hypothetical protein LBB82_01500 [Treponema sp.]|nr:hypothetical protein [Treponema sp.]